MADAHILERRGEVELKAGSRCYVCDRPIKTGQLVFLSKTWIHAVCRVAEQAW